MTALNPASSSRRDVLAGLGALAASTVSSVASGANLGDTFVSGRVLSAGRAAGIPGVMVSNGRDVAVTDSIGRWELPNTSDDAVFIIKPPGWTHANSSGVPQLSQTSYSSNRGTCDFYLVAQVEPVAFEVALLADTQAANAQELDYVRREVERHLPGKGFAFAINHGDVMGDDLRLFVPYKSILNSTGLLWHHCPGNHDLDLSSPTHNKAFETWKREIGPTHYAFQYANATFLMLSNVEYFGAGAERIDGRLYRGRIGEQQLAFVQNVLRNVPKDSLIVVSMHVPLVSFENPSAPGDNTADCAALMQILAEFPYTVSFSGHSHTTEHHYLGEEAGFSRATPHHHHVLTAFCGSWWGGPLNAEGIPVSDSRDGSPRGFHVLRVDGNTYRTHFVAVGEGADKVARLSTLSSSISESCAPGATIAVDVFDGGPKTQIRCRPTASAERFQMTRTTIADPHITESYARHRDLLKPWVSAAPSSHMWTASAPLRAGSECVLEIIDEYGVERHVQILV